MQLKILKHGWKRKIGFSFFLQLVTYIFNWNLCTCTFLNVWLVTSQGFLYNFLLGERKMLQIYWRRFVNNNNIIFSLCLLLKKLSEVSLFRYFWGNFCTIFLYKIVIFCVATLYSFNLACGKNISTVYSL